MNNTLYATIKKCEVRSKSQSIQPESVNLKLLLLKYLLYSKFLYMAKSFPVETSSSYNEDYIQDINKYTTQEINEDSLEQRLQLDVAAHFAHFEKIKSIYYHKYKEEICFIILIDTKQYDDKLMDKLLNTEYEIRLKYPEIVFQFNYYPEGIIKPEEIIHPGNQCIFKR